MQLAGDNKSSVRPEDNSLLVLQPRQTQEMELHQTEACLQWFLDLVLCKAYLASCRRNAYKYNPLHGLCRWSCVRVQQTVKCVMLGWGASYHPGRLSSPSTSQGHDAASMQIITLARPLDDESAINVYL